MPQGQKHFKTEEDENVDNLGVAPASPVPKKKVNPVVATKRRCVSTACIACRRRKSKVSIHILIASQATINIIR